jgi:hypothetical protein
MVEKLTVTFQKAAVSLTPAGLASDIYSLTTSICLSNTWLVKRSRACLAEAVAKRVCTE